VDEIKCAARDSLVYSNALGPVQVRLLSARTLHGQVVSVVDLLSSLGPTLGAVERSIAQLQFDDKTLPLRPDGTVKNTSLSASRWPSLI